MAISATVHRGLRRCPVAFVSIVHCRISFAIGLWFKIHMNRWKPVHINIVQLEHGQRCILSQRRRNSRRRPNWRSYDNVKKNTRLYHGIHIIISDSETTDNENHSNVPNGADTADSQQQYFQHYFADCCRRVSLAECALAFREIRMTVIYMLTYYKRVSACRTLNCVAECNSSAI